MRIFSAVILVFTIITLIFAHSVYALSVLDKVNGEVKSAKTSLEDAKASLNKAEDIIDKVLGVFKFVEEKVSMLYNFESFVNKVYSDALNWAQSTLTWVKEEKLEEEKKLNYEYNNCYSYIQRKR